MITYSFIIPCHNEENDIPTTLDRCLAIKPHRPYEIIVIDNSSKDNTPDILQKYQEDYQQISLYFCEEMASVTKARNLGIKKAKGDILIFLNADELPPEDFIEKIDKHYVLGADYIFPQSTVSNQNCYYGIYRQAYRLSRYKFPNNILWSQGFSCRTSLVRSVGGFDERYSKCGGEDWDFVTRIELGSRRVVDWDIEVQHTVPEKTSEQLWHMWNRGRGSAYFDYYRRGKSPSAFLFRVLVSVILIALIAHEMQQSIILLCIVLFLLTNSVFQTGYNLAICIGRPLLIFPMIIINLMDRVLRFIGYFLVSLKKFSY